MDQNVSCTKVTKKQPPRTRCAEAVVLNITELPVVKYQI